MSTLVVFQKEAHPGADYIPAREVSVITEVKPSLVEQEAIRKVRFGFKAYLVKFHNLPPEHMLITACEEAVRAKTAFRLPDVQAQTVKESPRVIQTKR